MKQLIATIPAQKSPVQTPSATATVAGILRPPLTTVGQHIRRIGGGIVRLRAVSVAAEIRRDDPVPLPGESAGRAIAEHVRARTHETVQQHQRAPGPRLTASQLHAVATGESISAHTVSDRSHPGQALAATPKTPVPGRRNGAGRVRKVSAPVRVLQRARFPSRHLAGEPGRIRRDSMADGWARVILVRR